jgi:hypothetical protein
LINNVAGALIALFASFAMSWVTLRWVARPPRVAVWWCLAGLVVGVMCWQLDSAIDNYNRCLYWSSYEEGWRLNYALENQFRPWYHPVNWGPLPECSFLTSLLRELWWNGSRVALPMISGLAAAAALALRTWMNRTSGGAHLGASYADPAPKGDADAQSPVVHRGPTMWSRIRLGRA